MNDKCQFWTYDTFNQICKRQTAQAPENIQQDETGYMHRGPRFCNSMTTTEIVNLEMKEIQVHYGPELPWEFKEHCHVKINDSYSMLTGGRDFPLRTLFGYRDLAEFAVKPGPNMRYPRYQHACAHIKHKNGSNYIIVAGGHLPQEAGIEEHADDSTDIFDLDKNIWYQGKYIRLCILGIDFGKISTIMT